MSSNKQSKIKLSNTFERAGVFEIGLISVISLGALHLGIGVTYACLKIHGKTPSIKHWLKIAVKGVDKRSAHSIINLIGISLG